MWALNLNPISILHLTVFDAVDVDPFKSDLCSSMIQSEWMTSISFSSVAFEATSFHSEKTGSNSDKSPLSEPKLSLAWDRFLVGVDVMINRQVPVTH